MSGTNEPNPIGRPTDYDPKYCKDLLQHQGTGGTFQTFVGYIYLKYNVYASRSALYLWAEKHEEFMNAKKTGAELCAMWWEAQGRKQIEKKDQNFPQAVYIFTMKNVAGWRDKIDLEHSGSRGGPIQYSDLSDAELDARIKAVSKRLKGDKKRKGKKPSGTDKP